MANFQSLPILDLSLADDPTQKPLLLQQLRDALFDIGFLYVVNHGVPSECIQQLASSLPALFDLPDGEKIRLSKLNSPHFLGYSGFAEETTLGKQDLREQFDFGTELPVVQRASSGKAQGCDLSQQFWRLRGPNQWPSEHLLPGFKKAFIEYARALSREVVDD